MGHYASDPECPLYTKASLHMMTMTAQSAEAGPSRIDDDNEPDVEIEETPALHEDEELKDELHDDYQEEPLDGSQYDPDDDQYYDDEYFDPYNYPDDQNDDPEPDEHLFAIRAYSDDVTDDSEEFGVSEQEIREFEDLIRGVELPQDPDTTIRPDDNDDSHAGPSTLREEQDPGIQPKDITHRNVREIYHRVSEEVFFSLIELRLRMGARDLRETQIESSHRQNEIARLERDLRTSRLETINVRNIYQRERIARNTAEQRAVTAESSLRQLTPPLYNFDAPPGYEPRATAGPSAIPVNRPSPRALLGDSLYNDSPLRQRARPPSTPSDSSGSDGERTDPPRPSSITLTASSSRTQTIARTTGSNAWAEVLARHRAATGEHRLAAISAPEHAYRSTVHASTSAQQRPRTTGRCMVFEVAVRNLKARVLLDSGSTLNCIIPDFVQAAGLHPFQLSSPVQLQLGCVGSRSKTNFGLRTRIQLGASTHDVYLDVVNIDHYDIILGVSFMHDTQMTMSWSDYTITFGDTTVAALQGEGASLAQNARRNPRDRNGQRPPDTLNSVRETA